MEECGARSRLVAGCLVVTAMLCVGRGSAQTSGGSTELLRPADLEGFQAPPLQFFPAKSVRSIRGHEDPTRGAFRQLQR